MLKNLIEHQIKHINGKPFILFQQRNKNILSLHETMNLEVSETKFML
jgi:hypothetical protein